MTNDTTRRGGAALAVVLTATVAWAMLVSLVVPVLPLMQHDLGTDQRTVTWVLTAYLLSASVATPIVGRLGDTVGKKRTLVVVLVVFAAGVALAGAASSIELMIAARAIQGVGGAILPLGFGILRDEMPPERVAFAVSTNAASVAVGSGLGVVVAGPITSVLDYHSLFWITLVLVVAGATAAAVAVPESPLRPRTRIDVVPALLLTGWLVALLLAVSQGGDWGWTSAPTLVLGGVALAALAAWVWTETRSPSPLVDMRMMRIPAVWTTNLVALLFGVCMYSMLSALPQFLQTPASEGYGFGASVTDSGLFLLPMTVVMFAFGLLASPAAARVGAKRVVFAGAALTALPFVLLAWEHDQRWEIYLASALLGGGLGFSFAAMSNIIVAAVPVHQTGVASGMNANIRTIGGSIGAAVTTSIVTAHVHADGLPRESGYTSGFAFLLVVGLAAAGAALLIPGAEAGAILPEPLLEAD